VKVSASKSLLVCCLLVFSALIAVPPVSQALGSVIGNDSTVSAYAPSPLIISIKNGLSLPIVGLVIAPEMTWQLDNSASCGTHLKVAVQSSAAVQCEGILEPHVTDVLNLGHVNLKRNVASSFSSSITIVVETESGQPSQAMKVPFTVPWTHLSFVIKDVSGTLQGGSLVSFVPANDAAANVPIRSPIIASGTSSGPTATYPFLTDYYFSLMSNDSAIWYSGSSWLNYPNFYKYADSYSPSASCPNHVCTTQTINNTAGFVERTYSTSSGTYSYEGLVDLDGFSPKVGSSWTISTAEIATSTNDAHVVYDPNFLNLGTPSLDLAIVSGYPTIRVSGSAVYTASSRSYFAAWVAVVSAPSRTTGSLIVYLNTGSGFSQVYSDTNDANLNWFYNDGGYVYIVDGTSQGTSTHQWSSFPYLSVWAPNNPVAEGTFDMNMWYLARHYYVFTGNSNLGETIQYKNTAVISDTDATPLWAQWPDNSVSYAGQAVNGKGTDPGSSVQTTVESQTQTSEEDKYVFTNDAVNAICNLVFCSNLGLGQSSQLTVDITMKQSSMSPSVLYTINSWKATFNDVPYGKSYGVNVFLGDQELINTGFTTCTTSGGCSVTISSGSPISVNATTGFPGLRYVSRHITEVTGDLLMQIGYGPYSTRPNPGGGNGQGSTYAPDYADPLLNFMKDIASACNGLTTDYSSCTSPYIEYYSPMFPHVDNNSAIPDNWYYQVQTFPGTPWSNALPYQNAQYTNLYNVSTSSVVFADPYVSRVTMSGLPTSTSVYSAQQLWLGPVQEYGFTPTTDSLRAEHLLNEYGSSDLAVAEDLLNSAQWNGIGTTQRTCAFSGGSPNSPLCYTETAYATYATATFLSAASAVGSLSGGQYEQDAQQALGVLEDALWSGKGQIQSQTVPTTLWQEIGGEMSSYTQAPDPIMYASSQAGLLSGVTHALQFFGYQGIQAQEAPGFDVADTEAAGITATAIFNYLSYLPGVSAIRPGTSPSESQTGAPTPSVTCTGSCNYQTNETGFDRFNTTSSGSQLTSFFSEPITLSQSVPASEFDGGYWINGTIDGAKGNSWLELTVNLAFTNDTSLTAYSVTLNPGSLDKNYNEFVPIQGLYPYTIPAGSYYMEFAVTGYGFTDFYSNNGYIQPNNMQIVPNSAQENFINDANFNVPYGNWWYTYSGGPVTGSSRTLGQQYGLTISEASNIAGTEADYGLQSEATYSFSTSPIQIVAQTNATANANSCVAISPESPVGPSGLVSQLSDYVIACVNGGQSKATITTSASGTVNSYSATISGNNVLWDLTLTPGGSLDAQINTGGGMTQFMSSFPVSVSVSNWQSKSVYVYLYVTTTQTSTVSGTSTFVGLNSNP
jgi:hypothetical protein